MPNRQQQRMMVVNLLATLIRFGAYSVDLYDDDHESEWLRIDRFILQHSKTLNTEENFH